MLDFGFGVGFGLHIGCHDFDKQLACIACRFAVCSVAIFSIPPKTVRKRTSTCSGFQKVKLVFVSLCDV